ncbi:MAG: hypothetical protein JWN11_2362, partial [Hyphomicrobiales bacterium]|nr:hypothetical protein [Hyphomicrobiales bacterium]
DAAPRKLSPVSLTSPMNLTPLVN